MIQKDTIYNDNDELMAKTLRTIDDNGKLTELLRFSNKFIKYINKIISEGYVPCDAKIRFICAWRGKGDTEESAVILPDIYFRYNAG